jgi:hypothetical protein
VWRQVGDDIDGESSSGSLVALSSDGSIVAVGSSSQSENGGVQIFKCENDAIVGERYKDHLAGLLPFRATDRLLLLD